MISRDTPQRRSVRLVLEEAGRPLRPQEICDLARAKKPGIGIATVYRTLRRMVEEGAVVCVTLPDDAPRYEAAGSSDSLYFRCRHCGSVYPLSGQDTVPLRPALPDGFTLERLVVAVRGLCAHCGQDGTGVN